MMVPWIDQVRHATDRGSRKAGQSTVHENVVFAKFHEILTLVSVFDEKIIKFSRWREFHCLVARQLPFHMARGALCL